MAPYAHQVTSPPSKNQRTNSLNGGSGTFPFLNNNKNAAPKHEDSPRHKLLQLIHLQQQQQQQESPEPLGMPLQAVVQLLQHPPLSSSGAAALPNHSNTKTHTNNPQPWRETDEQPQTQHTTVYLMDPDYLQNWFTWALHQNVRLLSAEKWREAVRLAALQYHLLPLPSHGMDYDDPGPIDCSSLSVEGHPLLLNPLVQEQQQQQQEIMYTNGIIRSSNHHNGIIEPPSQRQQSPRFKGRTSDPDQQHGTRCHGTHGYSTYCWHPAASNNKGRTSHNWQQTVTIIPRVATAVRDDATPAAAAAQSSSRTLYCVAVPEDFYESLRSLHGVRCDDFYTVSFQSASTNSRRRGPAAAPPPAFAFLLSSAQQRSDVQQQQPPCTASATASH